MKNKSTIWGLLAILSLVGVFIDFVLFMKTNDEIWFWVLGLIAILGCISSLMGMKALKDEE